MSPTWFKILLVVCVAIQQIAGGASCCCFADQLLDRLQGIFIAKRDIGEVVHRSADSPTKVARACCRRVDSQRDKSVGNRIHETKQRVLVEEWIGAIRQGCDCDPAGLVTFAESEALVRFSFRQNRVEDAFGSVVVGSIGCSVEWIRESVLLPDRYLWSVGSTPNSQRCAILNRWVC